MCRFDIITAVFFNHIMAEVAYRKHCCFAVIFYRDLFFFAVIVNIPCSYSFFVRIRHFDFNTASFKVSYPYASRYEVCIYKLRILHPLKSIFLRLVHGF